MGRCEICDYDDLSGEGLMTDLSGYGAGFEADRSGLPDHGFAQLAEEGYYYRSSHVVEDERGCLCTSCRAIIDQTNSVWAEYDKIHGIKPRKTIDETDKS